MNDCFAFTYICRKKTNLIATTSRKKLPQFCICKTISVRYSWLRRLGWGQFLPVGYPVTIAFGPLPSSHSPYSFEMGWRRLHSVIRLSYFTILGKWLILKDSSELLLWHHNDSPTKPSSLREKWFKPIKRAFAFSLVDPNRALITLKHVSAHHLPCLWGPIRQAWPSFRPFKITPSRPMVRKRKQTILGPTGLIT